VEAHPATEERVSPGSGLDGVPEAVFLERTIHDAFQEEAHSVTGPVVDEHQLFERGQRPSGCESGRFGGTGVSNRGVHGGFEDTLATAEPRIRWQKTFQTDILPQAQNR
jgi:hypothetical protein